MISFISFQSSFAHRPEPVLLGRMERILNLWQLQSYIGAVKFAHCPEPVLLGRTERIINLWQLQSYLGDVKFAVCTAVLHTAC